MGVETASSVTDSLVNDDSSCRSNNKHTSKYISTTSEITSEERAECPKCNLRISPFDLPEHLDMHFAKEMHNELRNNIDLSKKEDKRNVENKKRKLSQPDSNARDSKKQTDIKNFFVKR